MEGGFEAIDIEKDVPAPIGHYSHVIRLQHGLVLLSGQKAWLPATGELIGATVTEQTDQVFDNIEGILAGIGLTLRNVVFMSCHLANEGDYEAFNEVYRRRMASHKPARACLCGYTLRGGALVELVAQAFDAKKPAGSGPNGSTPDGA